MHLKGVCLPLELQKDTLRKIKDFSVVELCIQNASISVQEDVPTELPSVTVVDLSAEVPSATVAGNTLV